MRLLSAMVLVAMLAACASKAPTAEQIQAALDAGVVQAAKADEVRRQVRIAEQATDMSRAGTLTIMVGVLAFVFGHLAFIPRWVGAATVLIGVMVSAFGYQLIEFFGTDISHVIMAVSFGLLLFGLTVATLWYAYDWVRDRV